MTGLPVLPCQMHEQARKAAASLTCVMAPRLSPGRYRVSNGDGPGKWTFTLDSWLNLALAQGATIDVRVDSTADEEDMNCFLDALGLPYKKSRPGRAETVLTIRIKG